MQQERCHKVLQQIAWTDELVWHKICSLFYFSATLSGNTLNQPIKHRKKHIQYQALYRAVSCSAHRGHKQKNIFDSVNFLKTKKSCSKSAKTCLISWTLLEIIWWNVHQAKSSHLSTSWKFEFRDVSVSPSTYLSVCLSKTNMDQYCHEIWYLYLWFLQWSLEWSQLFFWPCGLYHHYEAQISKSSRQYVFVSRRCTNIVYLHMLTLFLSLFIAMALVSGTRPSM